jgi:hypothetical protein
MGRVWVGSALRGTPNEVLMVNDLTTKKNDDVTT